MIIDTDYIKNHFPDWQNYLTKPFLDFTVSGVTVAPSADDTYSNNGVTFKIISIDLTAGDGTIRGEFTVGEGNPQAAGELTRVSGAGDVTIAFSYYDKVQAPVESLISEKIAIAEAEISRVYKVDDFSVDDYPDHLADKIFKLSRWHIFAHNRYGIRLKKGEPIYDDYLSVKKELEDIRKGADSSSDESGQNTLGVYLKSDAAFYKDY